MSTFDWDFSKIPENDVDKVIELYQNEDWGELMFLHNKYNLSNYEYCCTGYYGAIEKWFKHGIESGAIKSSDDRQTD